MAALTGTRAPRRRVTPPQPSDPAAAVAMRAALAEQRAAGKDFGTAWEAALAAALADVAPPEREQWQAALAETRHAWECGYAREAVGTALFVAA